MERYVFIHGSSVGQSAFVPTGAPEAICNDIAVKYFQGRVLRQKESAAKKALFIDLYSSSHGVYSLYSFVNNACYGANDRDGQYFAISILCKGVYVYPESVYTVLNSAYDAMFKSGNILRTAEDGEPKYVISQFNEQIDYLSAFLKKVEEAFDKVLAGQARVLGTNTKSADYDAWRGHKVSIDICNSNATYNALSEIGRLYVSAEYESASETVVLLQAQVQRLQTEINEIENKHLEAKRSMKSKERHEIESLNSLIHQKDVEINSLQSQNAEYEATIDVVSKELEKYAKIGQSVINVQNQTTQIQSKGWKDALKWCLLILIFFLTLLSALVNFGFFRDFSSLPEEKQTGEIKEKVGSNTASTVAKEASSLTIAPKDLEFDATGGKETIKVVTDGDWDAPVLPEVDWISCAKLDDSILELEVLANTAAERSHTFMLTSKPLECQVTVTQKGVITTGTSAGYNIQVTDEDGNVITEGSTVYPGQKLIAKVSNPSPSASGYGWASSNCTHDGGENNWNTVNVTVCSESGKTVIIAYGKLGQDNRDKRTRFTLKSGEN